MGGWWSHLRGLIVSGYGGGSTLQIPEIPHTNYKTNTFTPMKMKKIYARISRQVDLCVVRSVGEWFERSAALSVLLLCFVPGGRVAPTRSSSHQPQD